MFSSFTGNKKTVAGVLSAFHKTVADLEVVEAQQKAEAARHADIIEQSKLAHSNALTESAQARSVIGKMLDIISPFASAPSPAAVNDDCATAMGMATLGYVTASR